MITVRQYRTVYHYLAAEIQPDEEQRHGCEHSINRIQPRHEHLCLEVQVLETAEKYGSYYCRLECVFVFNLDCRYELVHSRHYEHGKNVESQKKEMENNGFPSYDLLFCHPNGNPISDSTLVKRFKKLIRDHGLREVDLYSLRHSGATFKLTMSHDIKAVQGDMGHTSSEMLLEIYSTITDESRQELADHPDQFFKALDETEQDGQQTTKKTNEDDTNTTK